MLTKYEQDKQLLKDVFERHYFSKWRKDRNSSIEIYVYGLCKSNCKYCYLKAHQKEIYPTELNNIPIILHNFELVLDWYIKNQFICMLDFFSAEWLTTDLFEPMMKIMYDKFSKTKYHPDRILGADNMQFLWNDERTKLIEYWFDKFKKDLNIDITLSASVDGAVCDSERVQGNKEFYDKLWAFCEKYDLRCHPMVSATNVHKWIKNYQWWQNNAPSQIARSLMMLEVRNEDWHEKEINELIKFCDFVVDYKFKNIFNENKMDFLKHIFNMKQEDKYPNTDCSYVNIAVPGTGFVDGQDKVGCSFGHTIPIRLGDLTIGLCHRLYYDDLLIGKFSYNEKEIIDIEPINPVLGIVKARLHTSCLPHCEKCDFVGTCVGFCHGNSYEVSKNFLIPTKEVCNMYRAKISFLIYKYHTMGLWDLLPELQNFNDQQICYLQSLIDKILPNILEGINNE